MPFRTRRSNENTNGLLRQYFPKGTDFSAHSQAHLNKVARQLNERPRETLQFETQQRDLTPVLRRSVEPATPKRTCWGHAKVDENDPYRISDEKCLACLGRRFSAQAPSLGCPGSVD